MNWLALIILIALLAVALYIFSKLWLFLILAVALLIVWVIYKLKNTRSKGSPDTHPASW